MATSNELEDLRNLVASPGFLHWRRTQLEALRQQSQQWLRQAANDENDLQALNKLRQVAAAIAALEQAFAWPEERIKVLESMTGRDYVKSLSRGGV